MYTVNVYDNQGNIVNQLAVNDELHFVGGRISFGDKCYYKGLGLPYKSHFIKQYDSSEYDLIEKTDIFYLGSEVSKKCFQGKFGIFQEKYQPQFEDYIGSCGVKELDIIGNSVECERSSVRVLKSHRYDKENSQYYFELDYKCNRISYIQSGEAQSLYELLEYMMIQNWNFIWDKNTITDISYNGLITDVGDIFQSNQLSAKLGTIYSVLYSLAHNDKEKFESFIQYCGLNHITPADFILNSLKLMVRFGIDISEIEKNTVKDTYINAVTHYLIVGKNCGDCSFVDLGNQIRDQYKENTRKQLNL
jgi:hypothetical protein